ncbi:intracellular protease, PfpI family [Desulfovibrio sp. X2]|uniref:type 1 glutamine amidotransferase domain-containing protein n=1 Tax=Desulfovibrio sp. X2 TaxID=941449 RepID=UPI0003587400|nr:type 1 glutamine amidotransferase domain-containing protein [Desulfovibrio sp. X2]EPR44322.1 intracellular protease, PfpI family [Desulfovibrio sp. X2]
MNDKKALIVSADNFEDTELLVPLYRLQEAGYHVDLAAPSKGKITGKHGYSVEANLGVEDVESAGSCGYSLLVLPGGKAPAALRVIPKVLDIARDFASSGAPIAAICHGPQILISAGLLQGRRATCYSSVVPELKEAGVNYEDKEVVVDGQFVTSRSPEDLPAFDREMMKKLGA